MVAEDTHYLAWPPERVQVCAAHHAAHATTSSAASAPWPRIEGGWRGSARPIVMSSSFYTARGVLVVGTTAAGAPHPQAPRRRGAGCRSMWRYSNFAPSAASNNFTHLIFEGYAPCPFTFSVARVIAFCMTVLLASNVSRAALYRSLRARDLIVAVIFLPPAAFILPLSCVFWTTNGERSKRIAVAASPACALDQIFRSDEPVLRWLHVSVFLSS